METQNLVGQTIVCECGKTHRIDPRAVLYADDAVARMPQLCAMYAMRAGQPAPHSGGRAAVLFDTRTRAAAGATIAAALRAERWSVQEVLVPDLPSGESPICDAATKDAVGAAIPRGQAGPDLLVSVGAGVISDLGKWLSFERDLPAVTFGTAASMNGYAAANVASAQDGVKIIVRARPPAAVASSLAVLRAAPKTMTSSGLGDLLAKSVSSADWRLNHLVFGDYYCARSVGLIADIEPLYLHNPRGVAAGDPTAFAALFDALLLTGIAMTMAETSDPASGGEHLISHTLDMTAMAAGSHHDLHGRQVGVGTILASELYRRVLAVERPKFTLPGAAPGAGAGAHAQVDAAFWGPITGAVGKQFSQKPGKWAAAAKKLSAPAAWDALRAELAPMLRPPEMIRDCLREAGAAYRAEDIGVTRAHLLACLLHAHQMRVRFTVLDLAHLLGILPKAGAEIVADWA